MSAIVDIKCSNPECDLRVSLCVRFPVWRKGTPEELQILPAPYWAKRYVIGYESGEACLACKQKVTVYSKNDQKWSLRWWKRLVYIFGLKTKPKASICPNCGAKDSFLKTKAPCHLCGKGTIEEVGCAMI